MSDSTRTLKVTWHPNAITGAVERASAAIGDGDPDGVCQVSWMDLACLLDLARSVLAEPGEEHRETELWQVLDWSLWGNGLGDVLRFPMADAMVAALTDEQREQAEALIKQWHERRGPSMAVGIGTELARQRDQAVAEVERLTGFLHRAGYEICGSCGGRGGTATRDDVQQCGDCNGWCIVPIEEDGDDDA